MMVSFLKSICGVTLFVLFVSGIFFLSAQTGAAQPAICPLVLAKQADGAGGQEFIFTVVPEGDGEGGQFSLTDGESRPGNIPVGTSGTITEEPTAGWVLAGVDCEGDNGLIINDIEGGIFIECDEPGETVVTCTFVNVRAASAIPTLSEWGMIAVAGGLMLVGVFFAVRRRRAFNLS
jgi:Domain of unknown function (DUF5979)